MQIRLQLSNCLYTPPKYVNGKPGRSVAKRVWSWNRVESYRRKVEGSVWENLFRFKLHSFEISWEKLKTTDLNIQFSVFEYSRITEFEVKFPDSKGAIFRFSKTVKFSSLKAWKFPKLWNSRVFKFRSCKLRKFLTFQFTNSLILYVWNFEVSQLWKKLRNSQTAKLCNFETLNLLHFVNLNV